MKIHSSNRLFFLYSVGLAYANIELKTEVHNLSLRVDDGKMIFVEDFCTRSFL